MFIIFRDRVLYRRGKLMAISEDRQLQLTAVVLITRGRPEYAGKKTFFFSLVLRQG